MRSQAGYRFVFNSSRRTPSIDLAAQPSHSSYLATTDHRDPQLQQGIRPATTMPFFFDMNASIIYPLYGSAAFPLPPVGESTISASAPICGKRKQEHPSDNDDDDDVFESFDELDPRPLKKARHYRGHKTAFEGYKMLEDERRHAAAVRASAARAPATQTAKDVRLAIAEHREATARNIEARANYDEAWANYDLSIEGPRYITFCDAKVELQRSIERLHVANGTRMEMIGRRAEIKSELKEAARLEKAAAGAEGEAAMLAKTLQKRFGRRRKTKLRTLCVVSACIEDLLADTF